MILKTVILLIVGSLGSVAGGELIRANNETVNKLFGLYLLGLFVIGLVVAACNLVLYGNYAFDLGEFIKGLTILETVIAGFVLGVAFGGVIAAGMEAAMDSPRDQYKA